MKGDKKEKNGRRKKMEKQGDAKFSARGYCRVSTVMQAEEGVSLETQRQRIMAHCQYKGYNFIKFYEDAGISGKNMERPALQELFQEMLPGEGIVVASLSRLSRNTKDALNMFEEFKGRGVKFICLDPEIDFTSAVGELMFTILMAVHKLERDNISKHVSANMQRLSAEGKLRGKPPFGYKFVSKDTPYAEVPEQMAIRDKIIKLHKEGLGYTKIADRLNTDGDNRVLNMNKQATSNKISIFYAQTIKRILTDNGLVEKKGVTSDRKSIEERIISHRKVDQ